MLISAGRWLHLRTLQIHALSMVPCKQLVSPTLPKRETTVSNQSIFYRAGAKYITPNMMHLTSLCIISQEKYGITTHRLTQTQHTHMYIFVLGAGRLTGARSGVSLGKRRRNQTCAGYVHRSLSPYLFISFPLSI